MKRNELLTRLRSQSFDLLVIGGGIVGAGIARDAAMRGLRVALIDKGDFASGTSSKTSKATCIWLRRAFASATSCAPSRRSSSGR